MHALQSRTCPPGEGLKVPIVNTALITQQLKSKFRHLRNQLYMPPLNSLGRKVLPWLRLCKVARLTVQMHYATETPVPPGRGLKWRHYSAFFYLSYMETSKENFHLYNTNLNHLLISLESEWPKPKACLWKYALRRQARWKATASDGNARIELYRRLHVQRTFLNHRSGRHHHQDERVIENDKLRLDLRLQVYSSSLYRWWSFALNKGHNQFV